MKNSSDFCIVGGGVTGLVSALVLERYFPTKKITTLCFGGKYLNDIYINSAGGDDIQQNGQLAGSLFQLRLGIKGKYEYRSRFDN